MEILEMLRYVSYLIVASAFGWFVLMSYRWIISRSTVIGAVFAAGIVARVAIGVALFWISYLQLPIATSLQSGGGFWHGAADARGYYELAALTAETDAQIDNTAFPSPFYIRVLALWMLAVGVSPPAGMFLNLCLYAAFVLLMVWYFAPVGDWRRDLPCIVGVAAYSFSPVLLIHGTQPLKDELFNVLVAAACLSVLGLRGIVYGASANIRPRAAFIGALAITAATFGAAGIRWYYALIMWVVLAFVLAAFAVRGRTEGLPRYLVRSAAVLIAMWIGFWGGAGPYYGAVGAYVTAGPLQLINMAQMSRLGFLMTGGGTNLVVPLRDGSEAGHARAQELVGEQLASAAMKEAAAERAASQAGTPAMDPARAAATQATTEATKTAAAATQAEAEATKIAAAARLGEQDEAARAIPVSILDHVKVLAAGLAVISLPLSLVTALFDVTIPGGRGLLAVADVDTFFQDAAMLSVLVLLWKRRHVIGDRLPFVVFGLALSGVTAVLLGYVVTNFGTLWRLRSLVSVPVWVLVAALSSRIDQSAELHDSHVR